MLEVARDGADGTGGVRDALGGTEATPRRVAGVGGLGPGGAGIEREVHAGGADARGERAGGRVAGVARLEIDVVVRAGDQHVRMRGVDGQRRFVLLVLREHVVVAADADLGVPTRLGRTSMSARRARGPRHRGRRLDDRAEPMTPPSCSPAPTERNELRRPSQPPTVAPLFPLAVAIVRPSGGTSTVTDRRFLVTRVAAGVRSRVAGVREKGSTMTRRMVVLVPLVPVLALVAVTDDRWGGVGGEQGHGGQSIDPVPAQRLERAGAGHGREPPGGAGRRGQRSGRQRARARGAAVTSPPTSASPGVYFSFDSGGTWTQPTYTGLTAQNGTTHVGPDPHPARLLRARHVLPRRPRPGLRPEARARAGSRGPTGPGCTTPTWPSR